MITLTRDEAQQVLDAFAWELGGEPLGTEIHKAVELLRARLSVPEPEQIEIETLKQCLFQMQEASKEQTKAFDRLVRIMGTFDLATGHADGWNDLLDSLESELRDVLGHYREALKARQEPEPVACKHSGSIMTREQAVEHCRRRRPGIEPTEKHIAATIDAYSALFGDLIPADTAPPQREFIGLTDEEIDTLYWDNEDTMDAIVATQAKLREKNT